MKKVQFKESFRNVIKFYLYFHKIFIRKNKNQRANLGSAGVFIIAILFGSIFFDHISGAVPQKHKEEKVVISINALKIRENFGFIFLLVLLDLYEVLPFLVISKKILSLIFYQAQ